MCSKFTIPVCNCVRVSHFFYKFCGAVTHIHTDGKCKRKLIFIGTKFFLLCRLVREVMQREISFGPHEIYRITADALKLLQLSTEAFIANLMEDAYFCTMHRQRVTLHPKDIELVFQLRHDPNSALRQPTGLNPSNDGARHQDVDDVDARRARASVTPVGQSRQSVVQVNTTRTHGTGADAQSANRPPPSKIPLLNGQRQRKFNVIERSVGLLSPVPKRKRQFNQSSTAPIRSTERNDRDERPESPAETSAELLRTKEKPNTPKKPATVLEDVCSKPAEERRPQAITNNPKQSTYAQYSSTSSSPDPSISAANDLRSGQSMIETIQQPERYLS